MHFYISQFIGDGTWKNPFRALGLEGGGGLIDLRPKENQRAGLCILAMPNRHDQTGMEYLGDDLLARLSVKHQRRLWNKLQVGLDTSVLKDIFREMLHPLAGIADNKRWRPIRMTRERHWEAYINGVLLFSEPALGGGATDTFTRANESPVGAPWVHANGGSAAINLVSNAITHGTAQDEFMYYSGAASTGNQYSQWQYVTTITNNDWGPAIRCAGTTNANFSGYWFTLGGDPGFNKFVNGSFTANWQNVTVTVATGTSYKIDGNGSTIRGYKGGVEQTGSPGTDTSLTTGQPGVFIFDTGGSIDDFDGGDIGGPAAPAPNIGETTISVSEGITPNLINMPKGFN